MVNTESAISGKNNKAANFETAISATGYGRFHYIVLLFAIPATMATVCETLPMSLILPSAECDLELTLLDKGILNAVTYAGMISSSIFWGFIADTKGRKRVFITGFLLDGICSFIAASSQNAYMLMILKYIGGICGPFAVLMAYISEFHTSERREIAMVIVGGFISLATFILPMLAWLIVPNDWKFVIIEDTIIYHSWNIFLSVCCIPSLVSATFMLFLPESPKFLMSLGKNEEALAVFQKVFELNSGKSKDLYPVKSLASETTEVINSEKLSLNKVSLGLQQIKPIFRKPYLGYSLHVNSIQFFILMGINTVRLWLPQLFSYISDFENDPKNSNAESDICPMISYGLNQSKYNQLDYQHCNANVNSQTYIKAIMVGGATILAYFLAGMIIKTVGNKLILIIGPAFCATSLFSMYWSQSSLVALIMSSLYVGIGSVSSTALIGVTVNLFPTSLRTMTVALTMMFGRLGAVIGNILFPTFMSMGCFQPFLAMAVIAILASILSIFLPKTHKSALK